MPVQSSECAEHVDEHDDDKLIEARDGSSAAPLAGAMYGGIYSVSIRRPRAAEIGADYVVFSSVERARCRGSSGRVVFLEDFLKDPGASEQ